MSSGDPYSSGEPARERLRREAAARDGARLGPPAHRPPKWRLVLGLALVALGAAALVYGLR